MGSTKKVTQKNPSSVVRSWERANCLMSSETEPIAAAAEINPKMMNQATESPSIGLEYMAEAVAHSTAMTSAKNRPAARLTERELPLDRLASNHRG